MLKRALSALVGIPLFLVLCFGGALPYALGVTILLAGIGTAEFVSAYRCAAGIGASRGTEGQLRSSWLNAGVAWAGVALPLLAYAGAHLHAIMPEAAGLIAHRLPQRISLAYAALTAVLVGRLVLLLIRADRTGAVLGRFRGLYGFASFAYVSVLFTDFVLLRDLPGRITVHPFPEADLGAWLMFYVALCVWATDTFAFLVGRSFGRHKLAPILSPKKTVEGSIGGMLGATLIGGLVGAAIHLSLPYGLLLGTLAGVMGQVGDLFESALKREIGIKDFGSVMPGHGGVLDRFDSMLFVVPLAYIILRIAGY